jgi:acetyl-CoA carboxylase/biotin carboxylase 1
MKMYMPLVASEDGVVQLIKQPGISLEPGDILGILTLDDPARVKHAKPFEGLLPPLGNPSVVGKRPHQCLSYALGVLNDILDGFDNQSIMTATFKELIAVLHDPQLPYAETNFVLASLSGRISPKVEESIRSAMDAAKAKGDGHEFPASRIKKVLEHHINEEVPATDKSRTRTQLSDLFEIAERHLGGAKGHEVEVLASLLGRYEATESLFGGSIEARVLALREQYKDDLDKAINLVLSHIKVQSKVKLVLTILDYIKTSGINVSNTNSRLYKVLQALAALEAKYALLISYLLFSA